MNKSQILYNEDNRVMRDGIATMLNKQTDMRVTSAIGNGNNILLKESRTKHQVILMDVDLQGFKESSLVESIKMKIPEARVIGMGFIPSQSNVIEFVKTGTSDFILKNASVKEFLGTERSVAKGENVIPPLGTGSLVSHITKLDLKKRKGTITNAVRMTKREREIIVQIADSLSNKEIASQLNIALHTVKSHVHNIMEKLGLHSRLQIAKFIYEEDVNPPLLNGSLFSHIAKLDLKKSKGTITNAVRMTNREREIIVWIVKNLSNKEIALQLNIAIHTVKSHIHNIMEKLGLHSRLQIAKFIYEENL